MKRNEQSEKSRMLSRNALSNQESETIKQMSMVTLNVSASRDETVYPPPTDFENFLPYACLQLNCEHNVVVRHVVQRNEPISKKLKHRGKSSTKSSRQISPIQVSSVIQTEVTDETTVVVQAVHNQQNELTEIKLMKNKQVPRAILQIINLIVKFHPYLEAITIDRGIDRNIILEITKLQPLSSITELCFDYTYFEGANYYILLDNPNQLKKLSLSKCKIDDAIVEQIAERLVFPKPASMVLSLLNLSTNLITDKGARALASALRSNRQLCYLNLAGNMITDDGSDAIFDTLLEFPLTYEEKIESKTRYMNYLRKKVNCIARLMDKWKDTSSQDDKSPITRKPVKVRKPSNSPSEKKNLPEEDEFYAKLEKLAKMEVGEFTESFIVDVTRKDGVLYSNGNNTLAYINLCYNRLSSNSLSKMIKVFDHQNNLMRTPKGLITINIEGNPIHSDDAMNMLDDLRGFIEESLKSATKQRPKRQSTIFK